MEHEDILIEARAKITWGQTPESVREFLVEEGVPTDEIDELLGPVLEERRQDSLQGMWIGLCLALVGFGGVAACFLGQVISLRAGGFLLILGVYGSYKAIDQLTNWRQASR